MPPLTDTAPSKLHKCPRALGLIALLRDDALSDEADNTEAEYTIFVIAGFWVVTLTASAMTFIAVAGSVVGAAWGGKTRRTLEASVHAAAGALLAVTFFDVLPEAKAGLTWGGFLIASTLGYVTLWAVGRYVFHVCPSCALAHIEEEAVCKPSGTWLLAVALGVHCLVDGVAIVAGAGATDRTGLGLLLGVALHKLPEGVALGCLLAGSGMSSKSAFQWALSIEALTILGSLTGTIALTGAPEQVLSTAFAFVGGGFLYLVFNTVTGALGHHQRLSRATAMAIEGLGFSGTALLLWGLTQVV